MKILTIVGARPQFIKAAAVSREIGARPEVSEIMVHTGQHYDADMSDIFFRELDIPKPHYDLEIGSGPHGAQTGAMLGAIEAVLLKETPNWVLVYGDTNSTLAGALAASKLHVPVAHVEAGLRSFNKRMPEEQNRIVADHLSDLLLIPTEIAAENLAREGVGREKVLNVGDVMYDAALHAGQDADRLAVLLKSAGVMGEGYALATVHRAENTDDPARIRAIFEGLARVAEELPVVLPLHPRTRHVIDGDVELTRLAQALNLIAPVGYFDMAALESGARVVVTDSGGVQKEAYFHTTPCVTLRDETEWVELVDMGWNRLAPPVSGADAIAGAVREAVGTIGETGVAPYGDGRAAGKIVDALLTRSA